MMHFFYVCSHHWGGLFFAQIRRNRWNSAFPFYKYVHKYQVVITYRSIYQKIHTPSSLRLSSLPPAAPACAVVVAARFYLPWRICIFYDILNAHLEYFAGKLALWEKIWRTIFLLSIKNKVKIKIRRMWINEFFHIHLLHTTLYNFITWLRNLKRFRNHSEI